MESAIENEDLMLLESWINSSTTKVPITLSSSSECLNYTNCHWDSDAQDSLIIYYPLIRKWWKKKMYSIIFLLLRQCEWASSYCWGRLSHYYVHWFVNFSIFNGLLANRMCDFSVLTVTIDSIKWSSDEHWNTESILSHSIRADDSQLIAWINIFCLDIVVNLPASQFCHYYFESMKIHIDGVARGQTHKDSNRRECVDED